MAQTNSETSRYVRWDAPGLPAVVIRRSIAEDIHTEVLRGFNAVPKRGAEVGGLLLGHRAGPEIQVESFEPLSCEHRFGPSFRLSDSDRKVLERMLRQFQAEPPEGEAVVGFYRSHTRPDFALDAEDTALMADSFSDPSQVLLLIKPNRWQQSVADFFFWSDGELRPALHQEPFPFEREGAPAAEPAPEPPAQAVPQPVVRLEPLEPKAAEPSGARPALAPLPPLESLRARGRQRPEPARSSWIWGAFAAVTAILAGAFVYQTYYKPAQDMNRHSAVASDAAQTPDNTVKGLGEAASAPETTIAPPPDLSSAPPADAIKPSAAIPPPPAVSSTPPVEAAAAPPETPAPAPKQPAAVVPVSRGATARDQISTLLNRWAGSLRSGDAGGLARCYAPRISPYYSRSSARPADTRQRLAYLQGRYGKLAIHRIIGLSIAPISADMAFATVTKHWETAGYRKQAGEERQRLTLVRTSEGWKIAGEEEPQVTWVHRDGPR